MNTQIHDSISLEEGFEYSLRNLLKWLEILTMNPIDLCNAWGNYNVAWEIVDDFRSDGNSVITMPCSYLTEEQKLKIRLFLDSLDMIPKFLLVSATSIPENQEATSHSTWLPYKKSASILIKELETAAKRNKEYFSLL